MQTFVPYGADFEANASCLDNKRLGKQRVEGLQIINALVGNQKGWGSHPATRMWRGYEPALVKYILAMCKEWTSKGYKDTCAEKVLAKVTEAGIDLTTFVIPEWLNDPNVMISHRSNLVRKLPEHYGAMWPEVPNDLPYKWPV
jgi:hypothetical protein